MGNCHPRSKHNVFDECKVTASEAPAESRCGEFMRRLWRGSLYRSLRMAAADALDKCDSHEIRIGFPGETECPLMASGDVTDAPK